jgi:DNA-binding IclR family transcriptional regulator
MNDSINAIQKACRVLSCFNFEHSSRSLADICAKTGFAKSTTFRIAKILTEEGFLTKSSDELKYMLSPKVFELGSVAIQSLDIKSVARTHIFEISKRLDETVSLSIENNFDRISIFSVESASPIRVIVSIGEPFPLYNGATGRVLTTWMDERRREKYIDSLRANPPKAMTNNVDTYVATLEETRQNGYAITFGERVADTISIAAPIFYGNDQTAALAISYPEYRFDDTKKWEGIAAIQEATQTINKQLR